MARVAVHTHVQGLGLDERGKARDAQKLFEKALADAPDNVDALNGLGYCYLDTEHFGAAIDTFKRSQAIATGNGDALIGIAEAYKMRGDKPRALEYYQRYLNELPSGSKASMAHSNVAELSATIKRAAPEATEKDPPP